MKNILFISGCFLLLATSCEPKTNYERRVVNYSNKDLMIIMEKSFGVADSVLVLADSTAVIYSRSSYSKTETFQFCNSETETYWIDTIKVVSENYYVDYFLRFDPKDSSEWEFETINTKYITGGGDCSCELKIWNIDIDQ